MPRNRIEDKCRADSSQLDENVFTRGTDDATDDPTLAGAVAYLFA